MPKHQLSGKVSDLQHEQRPQRPCFMTLLSPEGENFCCHLV